jgi:hypothetical protein
LKKERWLAALSEGTPGSRPVPIQRGSSWKGPIAALLLFDDGIAVLNSNGNREVIPYGGISLATLTEDTGNRYVIQLQFSDLDPKTGTLLVKGNVFFMIIYLAFSQKGVRCTFGFTDRRLAAMGAAKSK